MQPLSSTKDHRTALWICFVLVLMVWFIFGQTLMFDFVNYDDPQYILENPLVLGGLTPEGVVRALTHSDYSFYHPLTTLSHMLDVQIYELTPAGFHLTNVVLHTASSLLLFLVLRSMTGSLWRSALVAAVFAIHPLRAESVAWVTERKDVLSGLFFMLTLASYNRYVRRPFSYLRYGLVMLCMAASMLSKAILVTLPFVLLLLDYWPLRRFSPVLSDSSYGGQAPEHWPNGGNRSFGIGRLVAEKIPFFLLSVVVCCVTVLTAEKSLHSMGNSVLPLRLANAAISYGTYIFQSVYPLNLSALYPYPTAEFSFWKSGVSILLLGVITLWVVRNIFPSSKSSHVPYSMSHKYLLTGWLWYLGMLLPVIGIVQAGQQAHADRYTYLSQIGLVIMVVWGLESLFSSQRVRRGFVFALALTGLLVLMSTARVQTACWRDSLSLWSQTLAHTENNFVAHSNLGVILFAKGDTDGSVEHFKKSLRIQPYRTEVWNNLAIAYAEEERWAEAVMAARQALIFAEMQRDPDLTEAIRSRLKEYQATFQSLEK